MSVRSRVGMLALLLMTVLLSPACDDDPTAAVEGFYVLITNQWVDVTDENHVFNLNAINESDGEIEGTFEGTEHIDENDFDGTQLTGSWADNEIEFTVQRSAGNVRYTGTLTADEQTELTFTSSEGGTLVIRRGD
ncbi:MAG: hypothetical protein ACRELX_14225 [Longimicrobiales bacterium]